MHLEYRSFSDLNQKIIIAKSILLILLIYLPVSCINKKEALPVNVIPLASAVGNYSILDLSEYVTEIRYIPLETNDSVLLGELRLINYENKKILIKDSNQKCLLFDENGKFCRKIGQSGQGPDDYLMIRQSFIHDNYIFLQDRLKILIYDTDGHLVEKINWRLDDFPAEYTAQGVNIVPLKKDTFVMNVASMEGYYPKAILFETHQSGVKIIKEYPNSVTLDKVRPIFFSSESGIMYRFQNDVRIYKGVNDTVFTIGQNTEIEAAFIFESGKYKPARSFFEGREDSRTALNNYITILSIFESFNHLFIGFSFGKYAPEPVEFINSQGGQYANTNVDGVFDKHTGELALMRQPIKGKWGFNNDIDFGPVIWPHYVSSSNELVSVIQPEEFMEYYNKITNPSAELTEIAHKMKWDDNPIVIVAKLK